MKVQDCAKPPPLKDATISKAKESWRFAMNAIWDMTLTGGMFVPTQGISTLAMKMTQILLT